MVALAGLVPLLLVAAATPAPAGVAEILGPVGGTVGFAALDLASGRTLGWHERESFPMQSVFKLPIAIEVLHRVDDKQLDLERVVTLGAADARQGMAGMIALPARKTVRELLEAMIINSDNVACDKLLALVGGPRAVDARMRALGVAQIMIRFSELDLGAGKGDNTTTPAAMVALLAKIARRQVGLSPASAALLENTLSRVTTGPQRLKGALPPGTPVAHKTGTSRTQDGKTDATNDVGLITLPNGHRVAIAVFVHASSADIAARERAIARLARAASAGSVVAGAVPLAMAGPAVIAAAETFAAGHPGLVAAGTAIAAGEGGIVMGGAPGVAGAAAEEIAGGGRHIALGLERYGLSEVAKKVGAETLLRDPSWKATLLELIGIRATRFTVSIEGLAGSSTAGKVMSAVQQGIRPGATPTNWELAQLYQAGRLGEVNFVNRAGQTVANPFH